MGGNKVQVSGGGTKVQVSGGGNKVQEGVIKYR